MGTRRQCTVQHFLHTRACLWLCVGGMAGFRVFTLNMVLSYLLKLLLRSNELAFKTKLTLLYFHRTVPWLCFVPFQWILHWFTHTRTLSLKALSLHLCQKLFKTWGKKSFMFVLVGNLIEKNPVVMLRALNYFSDSEKLFNVLRWQVLWCRACLVESLGVRGRGAESVWFMVLQCRKHGAYAVICSGEDIRACQWVSYEDLCMVLW